MLFLWIDRRGRLADEAERLHRSGFAAQHGLDLQRLGDGIVGTCAEGVFPVTRFQEAERVTCVWGDLYNADDLRPLLVPATSDIPMDSAALLAGLLDRYGPEGLARTNGQFAVIQWDARRGRALAATDRFAFLPLRCYEDERRLIVASDARMILACPGVAAQLDPQAIYDFVSMSIIPSPRTVYDRIRKLAPREVLALDEDVTVRAYERLRFREEATGSKDALAAELREVLTRAVVRRRRFDPPGTEMGAFLSGGLDSSAVVGVLSETDDAPVRAYSIGFAESRFDEMEYAELAARRFGAVHHTSTVTARDTSAVLDALLDEYDEPFGNSSAVPVYWCAKLAADMGVDTLYGGDGGDELFAGNPQYLRDRYFQIYGAVPRWLARGVIEPVVHHFPLGSRIRLVRKARSYLRRANTPNPERIMGYGFLETVPPAEVFRPGFLARVDRDHPMAVRRHHYADVETQSELYNILSHELALVVAENDLRKVTAMSARAGVRVVYPMLDADLVRFAGTIPARWHLERFTLRAFYKRAMRGWLPEEIIAKEKKGFGLPVSVWLKTDPALRERMRSVFASSAAEEVFQPGFLPNLRQRLDADTTNFYGSVSWVLLILLEWLERYRNERGTGKIEWAGG